ncbi:MAG: hypothetical protein R3B40_16925 [Polyangiales bacterium]|nr:hypothetical protein [Sandaracinaceae bacterium]
MAAWLVPGCGSGGGTADAGSPDGTVVQPDGNVPLPDMGRLDGTVQPDGNVVDSDAGPDATVDEDGGLVMDAGALPDLDIPPGGDEIPPECLDGDGEIDLCACLTTTDCSSTACPSGTVCADDGCGGARCVAAGHPCVDDRDCAAGATCEDSAAGRSCRSPDPNCRNDRECPLGFTCESSACVDRRVPCDTDPLSCPVGYVCDFAQQATQAFCRRIDVPCHDSRVCVQPGACYDLDGDGEKECVPDELMCVPSTCASQGRICGAQPEEKGYTCGFLGSCAEQPCPSSSACIDYAGDGRPFCAPMGSCTSHSDCAPSQICAQPHLEMSPRCVGAATGGNP